MRSSHRWSSTSLPSGGPIDQHKKSNPAGAFDALEHTGIPTRWLRRPKLPSRNWLVFWGVVSSISCLYWYDRRQCRLIKEEYISTVRHLAEAPLGTKELPRRADVYACKWPGDDEYDRSLKFFKRYVKVNLFIHIGTTILKILSSRSLSLSLLPWTMRSGTEISTAQYLIS